MRITFIVLVAALLAFSTAFRTRTQLNTAVKTRTEYGPRYSYPYTECPAGTDIPASEGTPQPCDCECYHDYGSNSYYDLCPQLLSCPAAGPLGDFCCGYVSGGDEIHCYEGCYNEI